MSAAIPSQAPDVLAFGAALETLVGAFIEQREREDGDFSDCVIGLTAVFGDHVSRLFAAVDSDVDRAKFIELFCKHLAPETERWRAAGLMILADEEGRQ